MCDWEAVQAEYITSNIGLRELARKYGVSRPAVENRSRKEGWVAKRKAFKQEAVEMAVADGLEIESKRLGKIISAAQSMADVIEGVFEDSSQFHRHIVTDTFISEDGGKDIVTVEKEFEKVDSRAIKDLTGALKDMTLVLRNLYNLPTQGEREAQRVAAARLALEQRKVDAAEKADQVDKKIEVTFDGGDMEEFKK